MMACTKESYEQTGLPLAELMAGGVPSMQVLDTYIADLDLDLEENSKQLNSCLQDMLRVTNTIVGKEYVTPRDALLSMVSNHILEKDSCYDPEPDSVTDILAHAARTLDQCPGSEEAVLQDLLSLSSEQGVSLPLKSAAVDPIASTMSLNAVSDSSEMQIAQQWDQIALRLRRHFVDKLSQLPIQAKQPEIDIMERRRLKYVQSLITLQPVNEVWDKYQSIRKQQIEQCLSMLMPETETETMDLLKISEKCQDISDIIINMVNEDFNMLNCGVLKKTPNIFQAFQKIYLEKYSDEMSGLIDEVWDEIRDSFRRGSVNSFSTGGSKGKGSPQKSSSKNLLKSQKSNSLENVKGGGAAVGPGAADTPSIPEKYIRAMRNIVTTILNIEQHVDNLQHACILDVWGMATKKTRRKGSLKGVLKQSPSPEIGRRPNSANMSSVDSDSYLSDSMSTASSMLFDSQAGPKVMVIEKTKLEEKVRWDWKMMFKKIAPELARCVELHIRGASTESLGVEGEGWRANHSLDTVTVPDKLWGGRMDYPKLVSKAVFEFVQELEMFAVFALAGSSGSLQTVRTMFIDVTNLCLKDFHAHLLKMSEDIPLDSPMKNLYIILSSSAYIRNYLLHYDTVLSPDDSKKPFSLQYKQFVELVESLTNLIIQKHNNYITTSVLHDPDSHNWTEFKEFYEGERCSFTIQMWNYYLRGVQCDIWSICPPKLAQTMFSLIMHESLEVLAQRYARAKPSFRRVQQFRCDILSILLCVSELLYPASNTISKYLDVAHVQVPHYAIHNLCTSLLSSMVVVVSPLDMLYKVHKKGYRYRQKRKSYSQADRGCNTNWLSWIQPRLLDKNSKSYLDMRTTTAVYLQTKLLLCQPELNMPQTIQAYLMKDYTLSILFLTQAAMLCRTPSDRSGSTPAADASSPAADENAVKQFALSLTRLLLTECQFSDAVAKVILPVIDRCDDRICLDMKHVPGKDFPVPLWMTCLFECMKPFIHRVVKPVIEFVFAEHEDRPIQPISSVMEELPCGCRSHATATPRSSRKHEEVQPKSGTYFLYSLLKKGVFLPNEAGRDMVDTALRLLVHQISEDVFVLPAGLCVLMNRLEAACESWGMKTPHNCVGLKVIAVCVREYLLDFSQMSVDLATTLSQTAMEDLRLLAECGYHILVSGKVKGSSTPRMAGRFCKDNKDWVNDKLRVVTNYLSSEIFAVTDSGYLEGATTDFLDQFYLSMTSNFMATPGGQRDIENMFWMIHNNEAWLRSQLDIALTLDLADGSGKKPTFTVDMSAKPRPQLNPLVDFERIGQCVFDHQAIANIPVDWEKLLQSDLGLSELGFKTLLYNRHEMQDGAYLQDPEKKPVATLKAVFENEPRELG